MTPPLTIGLPVYNGAEYLERALDALLAQTFGDFRLLVSDNASTDATPAILERYARRDRRIEVVRQAANTGGERNFDFVIRQASTEYFMWAAHDDVFGPAAVERCLDVLRDDRTAALCCADVAFIYEDGEPNEITSNLDTAGLDRDARVNALLRRFGWYALYGVGRRAPMLEKHPGTGRYGADVVWTLELLLEHRIRCVPDVLFFYRIPRGRGYSPAEQQLAINHDVPVVPRPYTTMVADMVARTKRSKLTPAEVRSVVTTIVRTVAFENPTLRACILQENPELTRQDDPLVTYRALHAILDVDVETWPV
jgi:glycosyltransferase involved in cell wall biosynthesis